MKRILLLILILSAAFQAKSQEYENLQVSLLTVEPRSNAVYTIFGHTALRLCDPSKNVDIVFNWGTFDFNKPNFIFRFIKGETDYFLSTDFYNHFIYSYSAKNSTVIEQILDIPDEEKSKLVRILENHLLPENREYRYNYFFDNCTSRVRDIIEIFSGGKIVYPTKSQPTTFRSLIHECTAPYPWLEFGIDLLIGNGADSIVSYRNELWLPEKLMLAVDSVVVKDLSNHERPLLLSSKTILTAENEYNTTLKIWNNPLAVGIFVLGIYLGMLFVFYLKKREYRFPFALLFLLIGIGGCIVATTCFFSSHPCTWPNWNILWIHPLHLIGFAGFIPKRTSRWSSWYHGLNFVLLSFLLLGWYWIPQGMNAACIPFILCLWSISGMQILTIRKFGINKNNR